MPSVLQPAPRWETSIPNRLPPLMRAIEELENAFNGEVKGVQLSIADDPNNADHMVSPEEAIRAMMGRQ